ncbi:hypothetical protein ACQPX6_21130 [Actinomycetospora sp. CA-101289]|uniref:hypothetical protein n=1 Tax=Actinomycetospora sp. CA-101289 TaxID=3239893 RepID=UPI003D961E5E
MPLAGNPDALLAAADELAEAARALGALRGEMAAHARAITTDWSGLAAPLALERIGGDADSAGRAAEAVAAVAGPLRTYADELRAAQRDFAVGEQQRGEQGPPAGAVPAGPALPHGQALVTAAAERALVANEAAARALQTAADALPGAPPATAPQTGGPGLAGMLAEAGNIAASLGNAALQHPASGLAVVGGAALAGLSAVGVVGGTAATATGVGSPVGVPLTGLSAAGLATGVGLAGAGAIDLSQHALGDDRVAPFQVNEETGGDEATPPFEAPGEITGLTRHGAERAERRDGVGVSDEAMADAVANPIAGPKYQSQNQTYVYEGRDAIVFLNEQGRVVTTWATTSNGWRNR